MSHRSNVDADNSYASWMGNVLILAGIYNLCWGAWIIVRPNDLFRITEIELPTYPGIWQCVGMVVGVYGIGYVIAATNPLRHWPIVFVGFLGKLLGPIGMIAQVFGQQTGFGIHAEAQSLPVSWLWLNVTNDLIWLFPFAAILFAAFRQHSAPQVFRENDGTEPPCLDLLCEQMKTQHGSTLAELSATRNLLVIFLRHSGCTFCREALDDVRRERSEIECAATIVFVHMGTEDERTQDFFDGYALADVHRISDPSCRLYRAFELGRGRFAQLFGLSVWWRGFVAAILRGHWIGSLGGDGFQMPGVFLFRNCKIIRAYRHRNASYRPNYCKIATS